MSQSSESKQPPERPSVGRTATDNAIFESTLAIAREHGLPAVTIDSVATHSGVAKTTIYRRYDNRLDMILGVSTQVTFDFTKEVPTTSEGVIEFYENIKDYLKNKVGYRVVGSLIASSNGDLEAWRQRVVEPLENKFNQHLEKGIASGAYRTDVDGALIHTMIAGGMLAQFALHGHVPDDYVRKAVETVWPQIANPESSENEV